MNSIEFLKAFHPDGPWVLTAIPATRRGIEVETFGPDTEADAVAWIARYNKKQNLYFSVNVPMHAVQKKTSKTDIEFVAYLHVDIDPRAPDDDKKDKAKHLDEERARIKKLILEDCPIVPPTWVVDSGGGYQAFWKLVEPIRIAGVVEKAEEVERYNKQLELIFGGDRCHSVDHIMRLPGTLNIPDAKKIKKGRIPRVAMVELDERSREYLIDKFLPAPKLQTSTQGVGDHTVQIQTGNIERLESVEELDKYKVSDRVKIIIVQGFDPDTPKVGDNSRSEWLFDACCQMVRAGVPDEVIYSVITDPGFRISSSVLDKGSNIEKYATRQIQRAKEFVEEPWLEQLNGKFIVIGNLGGKCRIVEQWYDASMERSRLTFQTFEDFSNRFCNQYVEVGDKMAPVGRWWLRNPKRRQADTLSFTPGRSIPNSYNLWQGFAYESIPGELHHSYMDHIRLNICRDNIEYFNYLISWLARSVQFPALVGETAIVLRGKTATGKSFFVQKFGNLWGRHFLQVSDAKHLVGNFNAHLRDCVILFGDEAFFAGDKKHESVLKTLITTNEINIEAKGIDVRTQPNYLHLIMASNANWVVPSGPLERRFLVLDVGNDHQLDNDYFGNIDDDLKAGGYESLLYYLLNYDLKKFSVYKVPMTGALYEQQMLSMGVMEAWWHGHIFNGVLSPNDADWGTGAVSSEELHDDYFLMCIRQGVQRRGNDTQLGIFLSKMCPEGYPTRDRISQQGKRRYMYQFPDLAALREKWDSTYGDGTRWPEEGETKNWEQPHVQGLPDDDDDLPF